MQQTNNNEEYIARINRVMDYVERHIQQPLPLSKIAEIASFSPFHFHRIFTFLVGETPNDFIQRLRIEKAAQQIRESKTPITEVAYDYGFSSISIFSRSFRKHFGMTAQEYRKQDKVIFSKNGIYFNKNGQQISKNVKARLDLTSDICDIDFSRLFVMGNKIEIMDLPEMSVIYCRHKGAFNQISGAYNKLIHWAAPRGLYNSLLTTTITVTHDNPTVTEIESVRQSACIVVTQDVKVEGEIGKMTIPAGKYAVGHFILGNNEFEQAWNSMCLWFSGSNYQQGDDNSIEIYHNDFNRHPEKKHIVDICIPVKRL